jgi:endonuclease/exonuclease/phosphatase family metal-dependent hydrolase
MINHYPPRPDGTLRILTLNVAHGRNQAANQILLQRQDIEQNLRQISQLLHRVDADIVALQEADGPSGWSGNFDHVKKLAETSGYPWYYRANHAQSWLFNYGTAILSRLPVTETMQHTFSPSPPTFNKGFLLNRVNWSQKNENNPLLPIDIVSVHLDFSRHRVRQQQIAEMTAVLSGRSSPMIIMGDFNSEWFAEESVVRQLSENHQLSVYKPNADNLHTYNSAYRYDWILISNDLVFASYEVIPDLISDHLAVVAEIRLKDTADK